MARVLYLMYASLSALMKMMSNFSLMVCICFISSSAEPTICCPLCTHWSPAVPTGRSRGGWRCQGRPYPRPWPEPTSHARHEHVLLLSQRGDLLQVGGGEASLAHGVALNLRVEQGELVIVRGWGSVICSADLHVELPVFDPLCLHSLDPVVSWTKVNTRRWS